MIHVVKPYVKFYFTANGRRPARLTRGACACRGPWGVRAELVVVAHATRAHHAGVIIF